MTLDFILIGYVSLEAEGLRPCQGENDIFGIYFRLWDGYQGVGLPPSPQWAGSPPMAGRPGGGPDPRGPQLSKLHMLPSLAHPISA